MPADYKSRAKHTDPNWVIMLHLSPEIVTTDLLIPSWYTYVPSMLSFPRGE